MRLKSCLRTLGFSATNDIFAENAWYFRNALVRANYTNLQKGIHETTEYLEAVSYTHLDVYKRQLDGNPHGNVYPGVESGYRRKKYR